MVRHPQPEIVTAPGDARGTERGARKRSVVTGSLENCGATDADAQNTSEARARTHDLGRREAGRDASGRKSDTGASDHEKVTRSKVGRERPRFSLCRIVVENRYL